MATAKNIRIVGLEIEDSMATFKADVDAVDTMITAWELRGADGLLPTDEATKTALLAYNAISKPALNLNDDIAAIQAVVIT